MEVTLAPRAEEAFFEVLRRKREDFNRRVALAVRRGQKVEEAAFLEVLRSQVGPIVSAVAAQNPQAVEAVVDVLFDVALRLVTSGLLGRGSRHGEVAALWSEVLPELARFLCVEPAKVVVSLSNGAHNLACESPERARVWRQMLLEQSEHCRNEEELLSVGKVLAWRAGMALFRESALDVWSGLREELRFSVLGLSQGVMNLEEVVASLQKRWQRPGESASGALRLVARVGGFSGFGGPFVCPPRVFAQEGGLFAFDSERVFALHADVYGASCRPVDVAPPEEFVVEQATAVPEAISGLHPSFCRASAFADVGHTRALCLGHSHFVYLFG